MNRHEALPNGWEQPATWEDSASRCWWVLKAASTPRRPRRQRRPAFSPAVWGPACCERKPPALRCSPSCNPWLATSDSPGMTTLLSPVRIGDLDLPNRIFMAPLTRARSGATRVPNALMVEYYRQRASAGLILTEATVVTPQGVGYADTPGIWSADQVEGWKQVTHAVHAAGGRIFAQLWHVGRVSHPLFLDGALPVAPS